MSELFFVGEQARKSAKKRNEIITKDKQAR